MIPPPTIFVPSLLCSLAKMANVDNNDEVGDVEMTKVSYHPEHFVHVMEQARGLASSYPFATLLAFTQMLFCLFFLNFTGYCK